MTRASLKDPLSNIGQRHPQAPQTTSGTLESAFVYQIQQNLQILNHPFASQLTHPSYSARFSRGQYQHNFVTMHNAQYAYYPSFHINSQCLTGSHSTLSPYIVPQPAQFFYSSPYGPQWLSPPSFSAQNTQAQPIHGSRLISPQQPTVRNTNPPQHQDGYLPEIRLTQEVSLEHRLIGSISHSISPQNVLHLQSVGSNIRGPPRKPKQLGHALWVGNLPSGTTIMTLKDHFLRDATKDILSIFLISKSNCAFVNYCTGASCTSAMYRFHFSRINGVRIVCRLQRSFASASGVPTGPSSLLGIQPLNTLFPRSSQNIKGEKVQLNEFERGHQGREENEQASTSREQYFIMKSLALQDLESSVRSGIWATQFHNEELLNKAYCSAENVYLIFSVNRSGEYFGYARMASPIFEHSTNMVGTAPKPEALVTIDAPRLIPTPATDFAPKGRIIDDLARGIVFWEADLSDSEVEGENEKEEHKLGSDGCGVAQSWGKVFHIKWISTNRVPFYRTRSLRNPWNANREIKIARDGTELEPSIGRHLILMFPSVAAKE